MSENSKIEWTDHTFNPWEGCQKVGPGCDHCYAETRNARFGGGTAINWGPGAPRRRTSDTNWRQPIVWNKAHAAFFAKHGRRQRVFCASLADVFDNAVDPHWRRDLFDLIELTPNLDWMLLTKRIGNVAEMVARAKCHDWLAGRHNVILGATIVNQEEADRDIPKLLAVPAARRFLSMEPLIGPVDLTGYWLTAKLGAYPFRGLPREYRTKLVDLLDWIIVGGESGAGARPMHPDWARSLRDQCAAAGVPFLFKQWGEWEIASAYNGYHDSDMARNSAHWVHIDGVVTKPSWGRADVPIDDLVKAYAMIKVGKKKAGRLLDGVQHDGYPEAS